MHRRSEMIEEEGRPREHFCIDVNLFINADNIEPMERAR